jgi:GalNAc5-diNAcBac-PP-undecaprenol beta-1,3-glucosyltransferase
MPAVTVLVPTHEHATTLPASVRSALRQTFDDIEVLVVGDGPTEAVRQAAAELERQDPRVRFLEYPKGPKHGLANRHAALRHARGDVVCYLSDDDLWLPRHLDVMRALLAEAEFAHGLPVQVAPNRSCKIRSVDMSLPGQAERILEHHKSILRLSAVGHRLAAYRRLERGWSDAGYRAVWREFLRAPGVRITSARVPTVLHFPSTQRDVPPEKRLAELREWEERLADPAGRARWLEELVATDVRSRIRVRLRSREERLADPIERARWLEGILAHQIRRRTRARPFLRRRPGPATVTRTRRRRTR